MRIKAKRIVIFIVMLVVLYTIGASVFTIMTGYSVEFGNCKKYQLLLNEEFREQVNTVACVEGYRDSDSYLTYILGKHYISIHEIYNLS